MSGILANSNSIVMVTGLPFAVQAGFAVGEAVTLELDGATLANWLFMSPNGSRAMLDTRTNDEAQFSPDVPGAYVIKAYDSLGNVYTLRLEASIGGAGGAADASHWNGAQLTSSEAFIPVDADKWVGLSAGTYTIYNADDLTIDISATTGLITVNADMTVEVRASFSLAVEAPGTVPAVLEFTYDKNDVLLGTTSGTSGSQVISVVDQDALHTVTLTQVFALSAGDTLRLVGRNTGDTDQVAVIDVNVLVKAL